MGQRFRIILQTPDRFHTIECGAEEYIWDAAARNGIELPSICRLGRCLACAGELVSGEVDNTDADSYLPEDEAAGFVLLCRARPRGDVHVLTHRDSEMRSHRLAHGLPAPYA